MPVPSAGMPGATSRPLHSPVPATGTASQVARDKPYEPSPCLLTGRCLSSFGRGGSRRCSNALLYCDEWQWYYTPDRLASRPMRLRYGVPLEPVAATAACVLFKGTT